MALYRFRIDLSDIDRGVYKNLDLRIAMHPSEAFPYLLTRVIAFALNERENLEFSPGGLSDPDAPCIRSVERDGTTSLWIEVGNPSAKKLHKAAKAATMVKVYTYKDPENLLREMRGHKIHNVEQIEIFSLKPELLERLTATLQRDNRWGLVHTDGSLVFSVGDRTEQGEVFRVQLP